MIFMTLIFAHRGYRAKYPENTMLAFKEAAEAGADGIELDVHMTKDKEIVVIHDETLDRTTNGKGYVKDYTLKELKELDASIPKKRLFRSEEIPTLVEVLEWMKTNDLLLNIELKNDRIQYEGLEDKVIELVRFFQMEDRVILSSFNHYSLVYCHKKAPEIEIAALISQGLYEPWKYTKGISAKAMHPHYLLAQKQIVEASQRANIAVRPYTVNDEQLLEKMFSYNCDGVITDEVERALDVRSRMIVM